MDTLDPESEGLSYLWFPQPIFAFFCHVLFVSENMTCRVHTQFAAFNMDFSHSGVLKWNFKNWSRVWVMIPKSHERLDWGELTISEFLPKAQAVGIAVILVDDNLLDQSDFLLITNVLNHSGPIQTIRASRKHVDLWSRNGDCIFRGSPGVEECV